MPEARVPTPEDWNGFEPAWSLLAPVVRALTRLQFRLSFSGEEHLPRSGPVIVAANHTSHLDPAVALVLLHRSGRRGRYLALEDLWEVPAVGQLLRLGHMIPVARGQSPELMRRAALAAIDADQAVVVYPEGAITPPDHTRAARRGVGMLALSTTAPVIPVGMVGVPPWRGRPPRLRTPVDVRVGPPVQLPTDADPGSGEDQRDAAECILGAIRSLLEPG